MPGVLKVKVVAGRYLPVMDRVSESTDAFVEVRFGNSMYKTDVCRKSLDPEWNSPWFKFEVEDDELQDEPLQLRVLDHDTYSANDAIGIVRIDLNPLLIQEGTNAISGWLPIYDTMHGVRGELQVIVKVDLFRDVNQFRQSSCGVQIFASIRVPEGLELKRLLGFVEELVVNDDPEYQWIDRIRTPRTSNEARQKLFSQLSGELHRKIGRKAQELGGNAILGFRQCFDLEGESGIVVRAVGTAAVLSPASSRPATPSVDEDESLPLSSEEFPFLTVRILPSALGFRIGGVVCARSVKLLNRGEDRDTWWTELRSEIRSHMRVLGCNAVLGYTESTSVSGELCVLSAMGTAVQLEADVEEGCHCFHVPYGETSLPFPVQLSSCLLCHKHRVPDMLMTTLEPPDNLLVKGKSCLLQARVYRARRLADAEGSAKQIGDVLPFVEYELHRQLMGQLSFHGLNSVFGLRVKLSVSERLLVATATATACHVAALPLPAIPKLQPEDPCLDVSDLQSKLSEAAKEGRQRCQLADMAPADEEDDDSLDFTAGGRDAFVLRLEDFNESDILLRSMRRSLPEGFSFCNTESMPGLADAEGQQVTFTRVWRLPINMEEMSSQMVNNACEGLFRSLCYKLRKKTPCLLAGLLFDLYLSDDDHLMASIVGCCMAGSPVEAKERSPSLDEECTSPRRRLGSISLPRVASTPVRLSPLSRVPGARVEQHLGYVNMFFIRESTAIKETGGVSGFLHQFLAEIQAIVRSHVAALGGNALLSYRMSECILLDNPHKNQAQCLTNVYGDAVFMQ